MSFSFFYSRGTAGYVRGEQMADYLNGKKNPKSGFENDVCIYVKILPPKNPPKRSYADVDDSVKLAEYLIANPNIGVIATSNNAKDYLSDLLHRKDIVTIPHAHCNYERWVRPEREVKTVGIIGSKTSFQYPIDKFRAKLKEIGLELLYEQDYWNTYRSTADKPGRLKVVDFHKQIDIQAVWRPKMLSAQFKNPNKLINAGSFGIPTVAYPEDSFLYEWSGNFIPAEDIDGLVENIEILKVNRDFYRSYSRWALALADEYNIDRIAELYKML